MGQLREYTIISSSESKQNSKIRIDIQIPASVLSICHLKHKFYWFSGLVVVSPYISRYTTCHKWASYPSVPPYHPNPNINKNSN